MILSALSCTDFYGMGSRRRQPSVFGFGMNNIQGLLQNEEDSLLRLFCIIRMVLYNVYSMETKM
jgi:hypothetical protein